MTGRTWWDAALGRYRLPEGLRPGGEACWCCGNPGRGYRPGGWLECRHCDVRWYAGTVPLVLTCTCCGRPRTERKDSPGNYAGVNGWCSNCTSRWYRAGRPADGPPPPMPHSARCARSGAARSAAAARRRAEYARLRDAHYSPAQAALALGMGEMTRLRAERGYRDLAAKGEAA